MESGNLHRKTFGQIIYGWSWRRIVSEEQTRPQANTGKPTCWQTRACTTTSFRELCSSSYSCSKLSSKKNKPSKYLTASKICRLRLLKEKKRRRTFSFTIWHYSPIFSFEKASFFSFMISRISFMPYRFSVLFFYIKGKMLQYVVVCSVLN